MKTDSNIKMKTDDKFLYKELTYKVIGVLMNVHTILGPGFPEKIYHRAVIEELKKMKIKFASEKEIEILYDGKLIGKFILDLIVDDKIVLELKAVNETLNLFKAQLISYLKASPYKIGILANFGTDKLQYFRFYRKK